MSKKSKKQRQGAADKWTVNDIRAIIHNPVYVGLGPYPQIISIDDWVAAQERLVRDDGAAAVIAQVRKALTETFGQIPEWMAQPEWLDDAVQQCLE